MFTRNLISGGLVLASALAGSACTTLLHDETASGAVVRQLVAAQTRPPAPAQAAPGLDGEAARAAVQRYQQTFQSPQGGPEPLVREGRAQ
jgi:hypothetical protein